MRNAASSITDIFQNLITGSKRKINDSSEFVTIIRKRIIEILRRGDRRSEVSSLSAPLFFFAFCILCVLNMLQKYIWKIDTKMHIFREMCVFVLFLSLIFSYKNNTAVNLPEN